MFTTSRGTSRSTSKSTNTAYNTTTTFNTTYATTFTTTFVTTYITTYNTASSLSSALRSDATNLFMACQEFCTTTFYHTGSFATTSTFAYSNSGGTSPLADSWYGISQNFGGASHAMRTAGGAGGVQAISTCSGGGFGGPSDRRLKKNIKLIGKSKKGFNIYSFEFGGSKLGDKAAKAYPGKWQGVMADELEYLDDGTVYKWSVGKELVDFVDYGKIDVEFKKI